MSPDTAGLHGVLVDDQANHGQLSSNRIEGPTVMAAGATERAMMSVEMVSWQLRDRTSIMAVQHGLS